MQTTLFEMPPAVDEAATPAPRVGLHRQVTRTEHYVFVEQVRDYFGNWREERRVEFRKRRRKGSLRLTPYVVRFGRDREATTPDLADFFGVPAPAVETATSSSKTGYISATVFELWIEGGMDAVYGKRGAPQYV